VLCFQPLAFGKPLALVVAVASEHQSSAVCLAPRMCDMFTAQDYVGKTAEEIQAMLEQDRTASKTEGGLKISAKRAVSLYGLGRFPVTLYGSQWLALADKLPEIIAFIEANKAKLAVKPAKGESQGVN